MQRGKREKASTQVEACTLARGSGVNTGSLGSDDVGRGEYNEEDIRMSHLLSFLPRGGGDRGRSPEGAQLARAVGADRPMDVGNGAIGTSPGWPHEPPCSIGPEIGRASGVERVCP